MSRKSIRTTRTRSIFSVSFTLRRAATIRRSRCFVKCLALDSRHVSAEFGLARAYQLSGNAAAAAQHLARFDELSQSRLGKPISSVYGEQGPYSTAEPIAGDDPVPSDFAVRLTIDTRAGLRFDPQRQSPSNRILPLLGSGACFTDFDADGRPDLLLLGGARQAMLYRNTGGRFTDVTSRGGAEHHAGRARLHGRRLRQRWSRRSSRSGLRMESRFTAIKATGRFAM